MYVLFSHFRTCDVTSENCSFYSLQTGSISPEIPIRHSESDVCLVYEKTKGGGLGGSYFPYILLNEIQTMFSQLAKRSAKVLPADLCTDHAHYVKIHRSTVLRRNENMAVEDGTVSHYYILVIRKFFDFMSLFRHSVWFPFSVKEFPAAGFGICNI